MLEPILVRGGPEIRAARAVALILSMLWSGTAMAGILCQWLGWGCAPGCGALTEVSDFGGNPGRLDMCVFTPEDLPPGRPLVVLLHGCGQSAEEFAFGTGWTQVARERGFSLLLPQQRASNNVARCFNWFQPRDVSRRELGGRGEAVSVRSMIERMREAPFEADPGRVYVSGLSAGAAMSAALLASYPELFRGGAMLAGVPFGCAGSVPEALACMGIGKDLAPDAWGALARSAAPRQRSSRALSKVSIWQGEADVTVARLNADEMVDQWTDVLAIDTTPDSASRTGPAVRMTYADTQGEPRVEAYRVLGMGHGVPVDSRAACGEPGAFSLDVGLCASRRIADFWGL